MIGRFRTRGRISQGFAMRHLKILTGDFVALSLCSVGIAVLYWVLSCLGE